MTNTLLDKINQNRLSITNQNIIKYTEVYASKIFSINIEMNKDIKLAIRKAANHIDEILKEKLMIIKSCTKPKFIHRNELRLVREINRLPITKTITSLEVNNVIKVEPGTYIQNLNIVRNKNSNHQRWT